MSTRGSVCRSARSGLEQRERDRGAGRRDGDEGRPGAHPLGQRPGVRGQGTAKWLAGTGAKTLYIEPGSPWENGYCESFNSKLRDEFLNGEIFYSMKEVQVLAERWRVHYNTVRPHSSLGYRPPAPAAWLANEHGAWRSGKQSTLPTSPHPRLRLSNLQRSLRYTNNLAGTKDRALQLLVAIGFSQRTCLPVFAPRTTYSSCIPLGNTT